MENKYFKIEHDPRLVVSKEFTESYIVCQFSRNDKTRARINGIGWEEHERHVISVQPGFDVDFDYLLTLAQEFDGIIPYNNPEIVRIILMGYIFVRDVETDGDIPADGEVFVVESAGKPVDWMPIILALVEDVTTPVLKSLPAAEQERMIEGRKAWSASKRENRSDYERGMDALTKAVYGFEMHVPHPFESKVTLNY